MADDVFDPDVHRVVMAAHAAVVREEHDGIVGALELAKAVGGAASIPYNDESHATLATWLCRQPPHLVLYVDPWFARCGSGWSLAIPSGCTGPRDDIIIIKHVALYTRCDGVRGGIWWSSLVVDNYLTVSFPMASAKRPEQLRALETHLIPDLAKMAMEYL